MKKCISKENRKLLALDIDGTLVTSDKIISPATKAAIIRIMEEGHIVMLASGRPQAGLRQCAQALELEKYGGYLLSYNGAKISSCKEKKDLFNLYLPTDIPGKLYDFAKKNGLGLLIYEETRVTSAFPPDSFVEQASIRNQLPIWVAGPEQFPSYVNFPVNKCLLTAEPAAAQKAEQLLKEIYGDTLSIYRSEPFFLEVMPPNIDKGQSIDRVLDTLGVLWENTICCGDGLNDISMIRYAKTGVAIQNSCSDLKLYADYITRADNDHDGIVEVIQTFITGN